MIGRRKARREEATRAEAKHKAEVLVDEWTTDLFSYMTAEMHLDQQAWFGDHANRGTELFLGRVQSDEVPWIVWREMPESRRRQLRARAQLDDQFGVDDRAIIDTLQNLPALVQKLSGLDDDELLEVWDRLSDGNKITVMRAYLDTFVLPD